MSAFRFYPPYVIALLLTFDPTSPAVSAQDTSTAVTEPSHDPGTRLAPASKTYIIGHCLRYHQYFSQHQKLLVACDEKPPELWDTRTGRKMAVLSGQSIPTIADISPDGTLLLMVDPLKTRPSPYSSLARLRIDTNNLLIRVWDLSTGRLRKEIDLNLTIEDLQDSTDLQLEWIDNQRVFIYFSTNFNLCRPAGKNVFVLLDTESGRLLQRTPILDIGDEISFSPDRRRAITTYRCWVGRTSDGLVHSQMGAANQVDLIDTSSLRFLAQLDDEKPVIQGRAVLLKIWSRDSQLIATLDTENVVRIWDTNGGLALTRFTSHKKAVLSMAFSYDGRWLLTTSEDSTAAIWDVRTGTRKALLLGHKGGVNTGAFDRTGRYVVTGSEDRTARLWKIDSSKCMLTFVGHDSGVQTTRFGHDEREIVAVTASGIEYHWKVERVPKLRERRPVAEVNECYGVCRLVMHNGLVAVQVASESEGVGENLDMK